MEDTKLCSKCEILKPSSDFHFRKDSQKYMAHCKECFNKDRRERKLRADTAWAETKRLMEQLRVSGLRTCPTCKKDRPFDAFYKRPNGEPRGYCKECQYLRQKDWQDNNRDKVRASTRGHNKKVRLEALTHYSDGTLSCACCGEDNIEFLGFDHIDGGGRQHRLEIKANIQYWLKKNGWPDGFQVLCHNCNMAKHQYTICPHQSSSPKGLSELLPIWGGVF